MDLEFLESIKQLQEKLNKTSGNLEKQKILKKYSGEKIKQLFKLILDSNTIFHVTSHMINKIPIEPNDKDYDLFELLEDLSLKRISGHNAVHAVQNYMKKYPDHGKQILNILDKDLKIGINIKQINKVFPNLIPTFSVALADKFDEKTEKEVKKRKWFISRKLDGVRCICIVKNNDDIKFFSRQGKQFLTLNNVKAEIQKLNLINTVFDGEIAIMKNGNEDFQGVMKQIRKKDHAIQNPKYFIFDVLSLEEFEKQTSKRSFSKRLDEAPQLHNNQILEYLPQNEYTLEKFDEMQRDVDKYNWEGLMLRKDTTYKGKRSKDILKVKKFYDDEFMVKGIDGNIIRQYDRSINNYKQVTTLGAVIIDYKGYDVAVGSGFSMEERNEFFKNPEKIVGKLITVKYFEETQDKKGNLSLRFPTFKTIVGTRRET
jgi:DNA ligase-1